MILALQAIGSAVLTSAFLWPLTGLHAAELTGRVVSIADGDTLTVLVEGRQQYKIRLAGIDAPERRQAFGERARQHLSELAFGQTVQVEWNKADRYGRVIGKVRVSGRDVNLDMVGAGMAWHYKAYATEQSPRDQNTYGAAESAARRAKRGLWRDADPLAPWEFRRLR
ncbi:thermonuclease family protein [Noviherbaspirillum aridicola]|uniref:TNase-like domain-containing protein n=1 Tax=Noviherbaspirillum aridicola TaxID=2849687 RepID=A0ABQ4Q258_9BURK|nr:thermonuclease family protein [Noviherbaspirillum aridicola]GIZ51097.1 hypothetical protein NCCP691_11110 [Noviherbaspirillum aridicola]